MLWALLLCGLLALPARALSPEAAVERCAAASAPREPAASAPTAPRPCTTPACRPRPGASPPAVSLTVNCAATQQVGPAAPASAASAASTATASASSEAADRLREQRQATQATVLRWGGGAAGMLLGLALLMMVLALSGSEARGGFRASTHWGGFGANTGGWQLSRPLVVLLVALALALAGVMVLGSLLKVVSAEAPAPAGDKK